jgi:hypothetical protein
MTHRHAHAFTSFHPTDRDGLTLPSRRNLLKAGLAGVAGLTLPALLRARETTRSGKKAVILLWMTGGPSQIDTLDPKPDRPPENHGPFGVTQTKLPGVLVCEHLPRLAAHLDRFTVIRSVDCRHSNHEPNTVMQTANLLAEARTNPEARSYPAIASLVAKFRGANHPAAPATAAFFRSKSHLAFGGFLGKQYDPFPAHLAAKLPVYDLVGKDTGQVTKGDLFALPAGVDARRLEDRQALMRSFDRLRADLDGSGTMTGLDKYNRQAVELLTSGRVRDALDLDREKPAIRERYGKHLWCQQALLARRLVEAGCAFVTLDLSYHTASGTWDTHGDNIPPYGGIKKGLGPLLPLFDHLITTLVDDLTDRGLADDVLVLAMGEFGRTPQVGTQGSTDGRNHWAVVMSMLMAGGGLKHGQVIGSTDSRGGSPAGSVVRPQDLAATVFRHLDIDQKTHWINPQGRPIPIVAEGGRPIPELF